MKELIWTLMQRSIQREIEEIAFDKRNAMEIGVPEEEVDKFITDTAREQFERYKNMSDNELGEILERKAIMQMFESQAIDRSIEALQEGDED